MRQIIAVCAVLFAAASAAGAPSACDLRKAIDDAEVLLQPVALAAEGEAWYHQDLVLKDGRKMTSLPLEKDYAYREIGMAVLDTERCTLEVVIDARRIESDGHVSGPLDGAIQLVSPVIRPIWNGYNTPATTGDPKRVVLRIKWRRFCSEEYVYYTPYSPDIVAAFPEVFEAGSDHLEAVFAEAIGHLEEGELLGEDKDLLIEVLPGLFGAESIDPFKFKMAPYEVRLELARQPEATLGLNGNAAYMRKVSFMGAVGMMQVWYKSCIDIRGAFPEAALAANCNAAPWTDNGQVANVAASALEVRLHIRTLVRLLGKKIMARPDFKRMVAASYNGGPGWVIKAYRARGDNWSKARGILRDETVDYLPKFDFVMQLRQERASRTSAIAAGASR